MSSSAECRIQTQGVSETQSSADWMPADKPTELSRIKLKNLNSTARPYDQQAFSPPDPLPFGIRTWLWRYTYLLLLISMLWHRQAIFESKWDKLSSSAECRIRTQGFSETQSSADWMPADKPTELSRIKLKNLNSTARPYDQQAFSPPDPTAIWHSHLALAIYIFVVVNFDALAQASDFRIERRQVVFLCRMQDSNPGVLWNPIFSRLNACWLTDWAIEDQAKKLELDSPSLWSASIQPTWPHCHLAFAPGSGDIHICCC